MGSSPYSSGMGELQRLEAQQNNASGARAILMLEWEIYAASKHEQTASGESHPYVGMGDLRRIEAQQNSTAAKSQPSVGMGDLRRFEAQQNSAAARTLVSVGMGDLRRFEAGQIFTAGDVSSFKLTDRVCPTMSTNYGERDAGASAPVHVLKFRLPGTGRKVMPVG